MLKQVIILSLVALSLAACETEESNEQTENATTEATSQTTAPKSLEDNPLVEIKGNQYTEYYDGKQQIKFKGFQDEEKRRHGVWYYYDEKGNELSMTEYRHGAKNGITMVKYPSGALYYTGEYKNDKQSGLWKTYNQDGSLENERDYGNPE